jgi:hypothetical protein
MTLLQLVQSSSVRYMYKESVELFPVDFKVLACITVK